MSTTAYTATSVFRYRWLIYELVLRDLRVRYRGSVLGLAWTLLNPLLFMGIYTLVFSVYFRVHITHYSLFLLAGLVPWTWFSGALLQATSAILDGRLYIGKTLFPTEALIIVPVLSNAVNFLLSLPILLLFALAFGVHWGAPLIMLPLLILIELIIVTALAFLAATLNVFYRDLQQLVGYLLTVFFYMTPIFYVRTMVPEKYQALILWNPLAALVAAYQAVLYSNTFPRLSDVAFALVFALFALALAVGTYRRLRESFTQYI